MSACFSAFWSNISAQGAPEETYRRGGVSAYRRGVRRFDGRHRVKVHCYVLMENHLHLVATDGRGQPTYRWNFNPYEGQLTKG
jgi:hypothetical protein